VIAFEEEQRNTSVGEPIDQAGDVGGGARAGSGGFDEVAGDDEL
jgi:hypothetical protein